MGWQVYRTILLDGACSFFLFWEQGQLFCTANAFHPTSLGTLYASRKSGILDDGR